jgi:hypothetical protein
MGVLSSRKQIFLLINLQHVSAQMGHYQVIIEEYANYDGVYIVLGRIRPNFKYQKCYTIVVYLYPVNIHVFLKNCLMMAYLCRNM